MDLLQRFKQHIQKEFPFLHSSNCRPVLAVSGGVDSTVLTDLFAKAGYDFIIAHCNFQLRGTESDRDEVFVRRLGQVYNKPVLVKKFDTNQYAQRYKLSIQETARKLRYGWFKEVLKSEKSLKPNKGNGGETNELNTGYSPSPLTAYLVTAHHANDNIETLLINLFRGTGISGLHGIPPRQGDIIRPLLFAKREEIIEYATINGLHWVEDSSNASDKYTRNFIRHQLVPLAKEIFADTETNLLQNIERFKEAEMLYTQALGLHKKKLLEQKGNEWHIPILKLQKATPLHTIVWEIIKAFNFSAAQTEEVIKLMPAENGSYIMSSTHRIINNRGWLIIAPLQTSATGHILVEKEDSKIIFEDGKLLVETIPAAQSKITADSSVAMVDALNIHFPLLLRKWKQGDYFYPLGMQKKKKLSRFFIDQKLSPLEKEKVWVLEMNKKIIWVVGLRIDDRFKIMPATQQVLKLSVVKNV
ncbi:MAG TPA: tRNA lysidine(34) synthetase TilS [Chitinophagaceae bacterium]|nr:tRNA lysidine(34) synthetase TilS [Chitinophagaceae bacterium]